MAMIAYAPRDGIRIVRPDRPAHRRTPFQEEWAPLDDPWASEPGDALRPASPRRLAARYFNLMLSVALSASVSAFVTLVLTVRAVGLASDWTQAWLTTLQLSLLIGLPARFLLEPYVARLVGLFVQPPAPGA